jgi:lipoyl-dependent peroxiredoxin
MPSRNATTRWTGDLMKGQGRVKLDSSQVGEFDVSFPKRASDTADGQTSPEELIAAAHSACLAMNLSGVLAGENLTAEYIDVSSAVTLGPDPAGGFAITGIALTLRAKLPGVDADRFAELASTAERTCPVTKALTGTKITLDAALD